MSGDRPVSAAPQAPRAVDWVDVLKVVLSVFDRPVDIESLLSYVPTDERGKLDEEGLLSALSRADIEGNVVSLKAKKISRKVPVPFIFMGTKEVLVVTTIGADGQVEFRRSDGSADVCALNDLLKRLSGFSGTAVAEKNRHFKKWLRRCQSFFRLVFLCV